MCRVRGQQVSDMAAQQVDEIIAELSLAGELNDVSTIEMFRGKYLKALFIGCGLVLFQQVKVLMIVIPDWHILNVFMYLILMISR